MIQSFFNAKEGEEMIRGTTPKLTLTIPNEVPLQDIAEAVLSISQGNEEVITKKLTDMEQDAEENKLIVQLTQDDTLALRHDLMAEIQVKVKLATDDNVLSHLPIKKAVYKILNEEAI